MHWLTRISLLLIPLALGGCAMRLPVACVPAASIAIAGEPDMAGGRPIRVDMVFVTDPQLARMLAATPARGYFAARDQLDRDFPQGMIRVSWEIAGGQAVMRQRLNTPCAPVVTLIFADYPGEGEHRLSLGRETRGRLWLGTSDMRWVPEP